MPFTAPLLATSSQGQSAVLSYGTLYESGTPASRVFLSSENEVDGSIGSDPFDLFDIVTAYSTDFIKINQPGDYSVRLLQNYSTFNNLQGVWVSVGETNFGLPVAVSYDVFQVYDGSILTPSATTITVPTPGGSNSNYIHVSYLINARYAQTTGSLKIQVNYLE